MITEEMRAKLEKLAERACWGDQEDGSVDDFAGGNIDDAYQGGLEDGYAYLAREILKEDAIGDNPAAEAE